MTVQFIMEHTARMCVEEEYGFDKDLYVLQAVEPGVRKTSVPDA